MSGTDFNTLALGWIVAYGTPVVGGFLFLGALGVPFPITLLVIASGAFIRQELLDGYTAPLFGYAVTILADGLLYGLGLVASSSIESRLGNNTSWKKARDLFDRHGGITIFVTRWLLMSAALPTTLIAGSSKYKFWKFMAIDATGELVWILLYGGLGYAFGSQWELISDFISNFSGFIVGILALVVGIYLLIRISKKPAAPVEN